MTMHQRLHTGEKHSCGYCELEFASASGLKRHERIHTGEKPYTYDVCEKAFASVSGLVRHKIIHTELKPYQCKESSKAFTLSGLQLAETHENTYMRETIQNVMCVRSILLLQMN